MTSFSRSKSRCFCALRCSHIHSRSRCFIWYNCAMYSLLLIFFAIPLYFSHVFSPLGWVIGEVLSFERQKVFLFSILICVACIEGWIRFRGTIGSVIQKYWVLYALLLILPIIATLYYNGGLDMHFLLGSYEKRHGYVFYVSIVLFTILLLASPPLSVRQYLQWSLYSAIIVACIALWEHIGSLWDIYNRSETLSAYPGRSSSTLGNPNYVAGYLLPFVPVLVFSLKTNKAKRWWLIIAFLCILGGIFVSGSYIAMACIGAMGIGYVIHIYIPPQNAKQKLAIVIAISIGISILWYICIDWAKILSLESRFILMQESLMIMLRSPLSYITGFGPDSLLTSFSWMRTTIVDQYFPWSMNIDSSHNFFIDVLFQYGIFPIIFVWNILYRSSMTPGNPIGIALIVLLVFLSLNVFVISHIIMIWLCIGLIVVDHSNPYLKIATHKKSHLLKK